MRKTILLSFSLLIFCIVCDQMSKRLGLQLPTLHFNEAFIYGSFAKLPASVRILALCCFAGFIFNLYIFALLLLPTSLFGMKLSLSVFVGGIAGNVIDRMVIGRTIDFIPFPLGPETIYFNLADTFQWIGFIAIILRLFKQDKIIWYPDNQRSKLIVNPKEQLRLALKLTAVSAGSSLLLGIFSYTYLRMSFHNAANSTELIHMFVIAFLSLAMLFQVLVFAFGLYVSHRTAGAIHALYLYSQDISAGENREFQLRAHDHFQELKLIAREIKKISNSQH